MVTVLNFVLGLLGVQVCLIGGHQLVALRLDGRLSSCGLRRFLAALLILLLLLRSLLRSLDEADALGVSPFESLLLQGAKPIRIALRGSPSPPKGSYSRWRCVGNLEDVEDIEGRTCVFENICYNADRDDFVFYARSENSSAPVIYDHRRGRQHQFRWRKRAGDDVNADFVALTKRVAYKAPASWSARSLAGPLPTEHMMLSGMSALSAPYAPTNLGHVAWDEAFPLLVAMAQLGVYTPKLRVVRTRGCDALTKSNSSAKVCAKFANAFIAPLTGKRPSDAEGHLPTIAQLVAGRRRRGHRRGGLLCFERLLVGGSFDAFNAEALNVGKEGLLQLYRARVLAFHAIDPLATPTAHLILLVRKKGRRTIANFDRVHDALSKRFGGVAQVRAVEWATMSMREQLQLLSRTTVAVSPCGGVSMLLPFLPEGAHAVLINYMLGEDERARHGECEGCSWSMESELWRHVRHVHKQYYQVWGPQDFASKRPGRDASVVVDPERLSDLVEGALHDMEPF